jgi:GH25 family lysozyme M1 (1,4-beta-N-acetylmuramidase)
MPIGKGRLRVTAYLLGVDASTPINWAGAKRWGAVFGGFRWGIGDWLDPHRMQNYEGIVAQGLIPIPYYVPTVHHPGDEQGTFWMDTVKHDVGKLEGLAYQLDAETLTSDGTDPTYEQVTACKNVVARRCGKPPFMYAPKWWLDKIGATKGWPDCPWWLSIYDGRPEARPAPSYGWREVTIKQWSGSTDLPGVGSVDRNAFYGTMDELRSYIVGHGGDEFDMATIDELKSAIRDVFNLRGDMQVPDGQQSNDKVFVALMGGSQTNFVRVNQVLGVLDTVKTNIGVTEAHLIGALAALHTTLSDHDVQELASALGLDPGKVASAAHLNVFGTHTH